MAGLGTWFVHGGVRAVRIGPVWYVRANPHAPAGPTWAKVAPQRGFAPFGVPRGRMEHRGPRVRGFAEIPKLALMFALRGSIALLYRLRLLSLWYAVGWGLEAGL